MPSVTEHHLRQVVVVAGEPSGDRHAADFVHALRRIDSHLNFSGMGGAAMQDAGVKVVVDSTRLAVVGLVEVLARYGEIRSALRRMQDHLRAVRPDLLVLVDYVEFNLRLARTAKALGIKVLFYISPQVWAWRPGRIKKIGRWIDAMAVLFPFEVDVYQRNNIPVRYVGNPLVDQVKVSQSAAALRQELGLSVDAPVLGLFPGSRASEIRRHLPVIVAAAERLRARHPQLQLVMGVAPGLDIEHEIRPFTKTETGIRLIEGRSHEVMAACDALLISSGTATLEAGLLGVPMVILYRVSALSYAILKRFLLIPDIGLVNIVAGRRIVPEFVQNNATVENLANAAEELLFDPARAQSVRNALRGVRETLGESGGSQRVAAMAKELIDHGRLLS